MSAGFSGPHAETIIGLIGKHPETWLKIAAAIDMGVGEATRQNPFVQSLSVTFLLLTLLGVGRSMIGRRRLLPTVIETIAIAAAAAGAGLAADKLIS